MDEYIARLNIEHFHKLLTKERDEAKRQVLLQLLEEEERKLAVLHSASERQKTARKS